MSKPLLPRLTAPRRPAHAPRRKELAKRRFHAAADAAPPRRASTNARGRLCGERRRRPGATSVLRGLSVEIRSRARAARCSRQTRPPAKPTKAVPRNRGHRHLNSTMQYRQITSAPKVRRSSPTTCRRSAGIREWSTPISEGTMAAPTASTSRRLVLPAERSSIRAYGTRFGNGVAEYGPPNRAAALWRPRFERPRGGYHSASESSAVAGEAVSCAATTQNPPRSEESPLGDSDRGSPRDAHFDRGQPCAKFQLRRRTPVRRSTAERAPSA